MPLTPESIQRGIEKNRQKQLLPKHGEEGILHRISHRDSDVYAKQWYGKHYRDSAKEDLPYLKHEWKTNASPFWFKIKYYEASLIREALPEAALHMPLGFDPRIERDGSFEFSQGRPTTVAYNVQGDPELRKLRDDIVDRAYEEHLRGWIVDQEGKVERNGDEANTFRLWCFINKRMREEFGHFLSIGRFIPRGIRRMPEKIEQILTHIHAEYPGSLAERLVEAGVIPVHAEVNYIPTAWTGKKETEGVFIEASIVNDRRLMEALVVARKKACVDPKLFDEKEARDMIQKKIQRLRVLEHVEDCWDTIYDHTNKRDQHQDFLWDSTTATRIFRILNFVIDTPALHPYFIDGIPFEVRSFIYRIRPGISAQQLNDALNSLQDYLERLAENGKQTT